ncbi:hypothetical protein P7K49_014270 [Saguinus oedipus]|uniref:Uncharacterized protein n=1 Tax=Saguinus oedipus TaxID=9490 RepID=A0ABQ9VIX0_SAGOE|nr:hypothetical protein P7K49_014270 [Saguinus oedipus]
MLEMKANFSLPEKFDYMDEVTYGELEEEEAQSIVTKYEEEARKLLPHSKKRTNYQNKRDYEYNRYRDYYRQYNWDWQSYYYHHHQDKHQYYRNYYGYQGYR